MFADNESFSDTREYWSDRYGSEMRDLSRWCLLWYWCNKSLWPFCLKRASTCSNINEMRDYRCKLNAVLSSNEVDLLRYSTSTSLLYLSRFFWYLLSKKVDFYKLLSTCNEVTFSSKYLLSTSVVKSR